MSPRWTPDPDVRRGRVVVHSLYAHLVFVPKYRKAVFTDDLLACCEQTMGEVCKDFGATLAQFNGERDHVHLLVQYPPSIALSTLVNSLKGVSSRRLRRDHGQEIESMLCDGHLWSPSYFAGSCDDTPMEILKEYIENQKRP